MYFTQTCRVIVKSSEKVPWIIQRHVMKDSEEFWIMPANKIITADRQPLAGNKTIKDVFHPDELLQVRVYMYPDVCLQIYPQCHIEDELHHECHAVILNADEWLDYPLNLLWIVAENIYRDVAMMFKDPYITDILPQNLMFLCGSREELELSVQDVFHAFPKFYYSLHLPQPAKPQLVVLSSITPQDQPAYGIRYPGIKTSWDMHQVIHLLLSHLLQMNRPYGHSLRAPTVHPVRISQHCKEPASLVVSAGKPHPAMTELSQSRVKQLCSKFKLTLDFNIDPIRPVKQGNPYPLLMFEANYHKPGFVYQQSQWYWIS